MSDNIIKLVVGSEEFKFWDSISITRVIDTFDTFQFNAPFEQESQIRGIITPLQFKPGEIFIDDELLSTIVLIDPEPTIETQNSIAVTGYAKPGVLNDCSVKVSDYPIEFSNQTLDQIAKTVAAFFDIDVEFGDPASVGSFPAPLSGPLFEKVKLKAGQNPLSFLIGLAKDRSFLISNTNDGKLLFWKSNKNPDTETLKQGHTPLQSVTPIIDPQRYYSEITGIAPATLLKNAETVTLDNPHLTENRPFVFKVKNGLSGADLQNAVKWKMGLMFANAIKYSITVQGLRDSKGKLWDRNNHINLTAPGAYIDNETTFLIKDLTLNRGPDITTMNLVLPESYSGEIPERLPWD